MAEVQSLLCKIKTAIPKGDPLQPLLTPVQYEAYLDLESMCAALAASHDPSKPLPYLLRVLPAPTAASLKPPPAAPEVPKIKKRPKMDLERRALPPEYRTFLVNKGAALDEGNLKLIFVRSLFKTDISDHHVRLSMPYKQVKEEFLTPGEEMILRGSEKIDVAVIEPSMREQTMNLARWNIGNSWCYALTRDWRKLVQGNLLVDGDVIQVWSFRFEGNRLGLLIHKVESRPSDNESDGSGLSGDHASSDGSSSSGDDDYEIIRWGSKKRRGWTGVKHHSI